ncbi:MAG TPA: site-specific DNA-methyltransferase, partial [bacterium]|nr:site-specific DNA-methyltransferase [bacterium]
MIYIDPPYNTGKEFIYPDNYTENLQTYLEYTGQVDSEGRKFSTNTDREGRFHSKWMRMMYPRLYLARNLLTEDGVIFISIDDNEVANLRKLCDEIFGEENFIANAIWERSFSPVNLKKHFSENHDFMLCYSKNVEITICNGLKRKNDERYHNPDNDPRGDWASSDMTVGPAISEKIYEIETPSGRKLLPTNGRCWLFTKERYKEMVEDNRIWFGENGSNTPRVKKFLSEVKQGITPMTIWKYDEVGHSQDAAQNLKRLFGDKQYFDYPKSVGLIERCLELYSVENCIVLDFFSGSCTTAHAVLDLNKEDGGNRKFIMVQLPEPCSEDSEAFKAGYKTIADIGKERIRRVIKKIETEKEGKLDFGEKKQDLGFKVLKLDKSNFKVWDGTKKDNVAHQLELHVDHIDKKSSEEDILYELILKSGFSLTSEIEKLTLAGKTVFNIEDLLLICLDKNLNIELIKAIAEMKPEEVIMLDEGFHGNDQLKTNTVQIMKSKEIEFRTV